MQPLSLAVTTSFISQSLFQSDLINLFFLLAQDASITDYIFCCLASSHFIVLVFINIYVTRLPYDNWDYRFYTIEHIRRIKYTQAI